MSKKVIFDTDPGIDDTMAMVLAHASENIDLIGITTVFGNATIENATRNALFVKHLFGLGADVSVGSDSPLVVEAGQPTTFVHGDNGLGNITIPDEYYGEVSELPANDFIIDRVKKYPGEITLIAVGRLTNLALALNKAPEIAGLVKEVIIMGGAFGYNGHTGNVTPFAEANILGDPHAADQVLAASWPVTIVGLDVTQQTIMTNTYMDVLLHRSARYGKFIHDITRFYTDFHRNEFGLNGFYVHDSSAVAYAIAPELFSTIKGQVRVVTEGPAIGHTMLKQDGRRYPMDKWSDNPVQQVCVNVDSERLLELYASVLSAS
ncbi:nucleoside hydrolase [Aeromonas jandaei]